MLDNELMKCVNCGNQLPSATATCPFCEHALNQLEIKKASRGLNDEAKIKQNERNALKLFFWFTFGIALLLLVFHPSISAAGLLLTIIFLGLPLFASQKKPNGKEKTHQAPKNGWSNLSIHVSLKTWLFLIACSASLPLILYGSSKKLDLVGLFFVAWVGFFFGMVAVILSKLISDEKP